MFNHVCKKTLTTPLTTVSLFFGKLNVWCAPGLNSWSTLYHSFNLNQTQTCHEKAVLDHNITTTTPGSPGGWILQLLTEPRHGDSFISQQRTISSNT